jgi:hypothetical protein
MRSWQRKQQTESNAPEIEIDNRNYYKPNQRKIFTSCKRFVFCFSGRRSGKSWDSCRWVLTRGYSEKHIEKPVWFVSPTYAQAKVFFEQFYSRFNRVIASRSLTDLSIMLYNGRQICFKGADKADNLRGAGLFGVVLDEIAFMKANVWHEVIRPMLSDVKAPAILLGTPSPEGPSHWSSELWEQMRHDPEWDCLEFKSSEMGVIDVEEIEAARRTLPEDIFLTEYEAARISREGQVFREFGAHNFVDTIPLHFQRAHIVCGVDLGYEHPSVFVVLYADLPKSNFIVVDVVYHKHGNEESHVKIARELRGIHGIQRFHCDHNRPDFVERFKRDGISCQLADKDVLRGIDDVRKLLLCQPDGKPKLFFLRHKCKKLLEEFPRYRYKPGTNVPNKAAGQDDGIDALRYAVESFFGKQVMGRVYDLA